MENFWFDPSCESERDFTLRAWAAGALTGHDETGRTWAVVSESDESLPEITYHPITEVVGRQDAGGRFLQWEERGEGCFALVGSTYPGCLLYCPGSGWAVDVGGDTGEYVWYQSPCVPADRIEQYECEWRERAAELATA